MKRNPEVWEIVALICLLGLFQFKVMLFELKNALAIFQRLMESILEKLRGVICFVYLNNIIFSRTWHQHFHDVHAVLDNLQRAGLSFNIKKSKLFRTSLKFLGHVVSAEGVHWIQIPGRMVNLPVLGHPDVNTPFIVYTYTSEVGLGVFFFFILSRNQVWEWRRFLLSLALP